MEKKLRELTQKQWKAAREAYRDERKKYKPDEPGEVIEKAVDKWMTDNFSLKKVNPKSIKKKKGGSVYKKAKLGHGGTIRKGLFTNRGPCK